MHISWIVFFRTTSPLLQSYKTHIQWGGTRAQCRTLRRFQFFSRITQVTPRRLELFASRTRDTPHRELFKTQLLYASYNFSLLYAFFLSRNHFFFLLVLSSKSERLGRTQRDETNEKVIRNLWNFVVSPADCITFGQNETVLFMKRYGGAAVEY